MSRKPPESNFDAGEPEDSKVVARFWMPSIC
jgi:hypothetical protein